MGLGSWLWLLNIDVIAVIVIVCVVIYFVWKNRDTSKKYQVRFLDQQAIEEVRKRKIKGKKVKKESKGEKRCREIFEDLFGYKFKSVRPDWLMNPVTGSNLELDGYSPIIATPYGKGLAFEYDGIQHAKYTKKFHNNPAQFKYGVEKDKWKREQCKKKGVVLINIPHTIAFDDLEDYIVGELYKIGVKIPE